MCPSGRSEAEPLAPDLSGARLLRALLRGECVLLGARPRPEGAAAGESRPVVRWAGAGAVSRLGSRSGLLGSKGWAGLRSANRSSDRKGKMNSRCWAQSGVRERQLGVCRRLLFQWCSGWPHYPLFVVPCGGLKADLCLELCVVSVCRPRS